MMMMKLASTCSLAVAALQLYSAQAIYHPTSDVYYHQKEQRSIQSSIWSFGPTSGVNIWSPDGTQLYRELLPEDLPMCGVNEESGEQQCDFFAYETDGHAHVWIGAFGPDRVEVFDIDTGDYVSYVPTYSTPLDLSYHPHREEMWLHCAGMNEDSDGHIDSFSTNSLSANFEQINLNVTGRSYGRQVIDSSLGVFGYATVYNQPFVYKLNLATKEIVSQIPLANAFGAYDMAYSKVNQHMYVRTRVTCTCGGDDKDIPDCGRFGGGLVDIVTGPSAGQTQVEGTSSSSCQGSKADTIGVYEIDTKTDSIITSHNILPSTGFGAGAVASPDGKYIMLLGNDAGKNVRVLTAGRNGEASTVLADIPVNFEGSAPRTVAVADFAIAEINGKEIAIFASGNDNNVAIVDLANPTSVQKVSLTNSPEVSGADGEGRSVEWAQGTDNVWVTGQESKEVYVLRIAGGDIGAATVTTTIKGVDASALMYVENYAKNSVAMSVEKSDSFQEAVSSAQDDALAIASLVLSIVAILLSFGLFLRVATIVKSPSQKGSVSRDNGETDRGSDDAEMQAADMKSLGSKQVM